MTDPDPPSSPFAQAALDQAGPEGPVDYVRSPCVRVCRIATAGSGLCVGCWRSLEEITRWGGMTPDQRRAVLALLPARERAHRRRLFKGPLFRRS